MAFVLGEKVRWISQAGGYPKEKIGIVVKIVPPNIPPTRLIHKHENSNLSLFEKYDIRPIDGCGYDRGHESYLIEVVESRTRKPKLYWPRVNQLRKVIY